MANKKVRFGLRGAKYALYSNGTYGALKDLEGAVSLSLSTEGSDVTDIYADDGVFYTFAGTNGGYSAELELAHIPDSVRVDLLGEVVDATTGVQYETTSADPAQFALLFETTVGGQQKGFVFYNCKASRVAMNANTVSENPQVDTDTLSIRMAQQEFTINSVKTGVVQSHIEKTADNTTLYNAFFAGIVHPGTVSGLSA